MNTAATFGVLTTPRIWQECDWTPGRGRRFGKAQHVLLQEKPIIGSATVGPTEIEALLNVNNAATHYRNRMEQQRIDFVIQRYRYYSLNHADTTRLQRHAAVARDSGLAAHEVARILSETYAYAA